VDAFVLAREVEQELVAAEDDVSKRHCARSAAEEGAVREEPCDKAAMNFQHAVNDRTPHAASGDGAEHECEQADGCGR